MESGIKLGWSGLKVKVTRGSTHGGTHGDDAVVGNTGARSSKHEVKSKI